MLLIVLYLLLALLACWLICGIVAYGLTFACFQRKYPTLAEKDYWSDFRTALFTGMAGPIGLGVALAMGGIQHGFKWK